ncbi:MAG: hypothetical protein FWE20_08530 [Defluviitaleaceae bacterium]|nr:hypothetical protein [Defluviitaleaceae bacterium]
MNIELSADRIRADIEAVSRFTATPGKGATRLPFTPEARGAVDYINGQNDRLILRYGNK